ncbi:MAG: hypothetical protein ACI9EW_002634 [Cellvibrionaceae bacterium]|jgi:hypothetical protein
MNFQEELAYRFKSQADFSRTYSQLYATLFSLIAGWVESAEQDANPVATWLLEASQTRNPFDVTLLLMAGLHEAVLAKHNGTAELARFYPTAGGGRSPTDQELPAIFETTLLNLKEHLAYVIQTATVQTNETARGSVWLLPLAFSHWENVTLLDLGASAGLNLISEQRRFDFYAPDSDDPLVSFGKAAEEQMVVKATGDCAALSRLSKPPRLPQITARYGIDLLPFPIETAADATRLTSYIWADQPERVERLSQALAIFQNVQQSAAPVQLDAVRLPNELPAFLQTLSPDSKTPLVIYNTYITQYFRDERAELGEIIRDWAAQQIRPVLWLQWEPSLGWEEKPNADEFGWCAWTADLWQNNKPAQESRSFHLGWVHPHGLQVRFLAGLQEWADFWNS